MSILDLAPKGSILQKLGADHSTLDLDTTLQQIHGDLHPGQFDLSAAISYEIQLPKMQITMDLLKCGVEIQR